ncbi:hypothetical protein DPMN_074619 [Dreissena polymorpha]|uniref:Uncharacterized protein n=1 Tax=Dreissena polymorpha TaxID=45954 RepID=A0A9D3YFM1_DREPO|nr:hypothetical protein DPMN_074619 [Dreissena polymorpha]
MTVQSILSYLMLMGCIMGTAIAGIMGLSFGKDQAENIDAVRALASVILVLCLATLGVIVFGLCIGCTFGVHFGVVRTRRRGNVIIINNGTAGLAPGGGFNGTGTGYGNQTIFTTSGDMVTIQEQNRILQDQIRLLQQHQQGGGYQPNAPPPAYGAMY